VVGRIGDAQFLLSQAATFGVNAGLQGGLSAGGSIDTTKNYQMVIPCAAGLPDDAVCHGVVDGVNNRYGIENWDTAAEGTGPGSDNLNKGEATIKAFERVGLIRTLAEPNLTSINGESAEFLAGGEFPVPVGRDRPTAANISVEFKPYGVRPGLPSHRLLGGQHLAAALGRGLRTVPRRRLHPRRRRRLRPSPCPA
jgi:pilus assembly protein CpaC